MSFLPVLFSSLKNYDRQTFVADLFAGITIGFVALPLAMAFAIASGLSPERGIFTAVVAGFLISLFGGSQVQIGGPTGAFVVIISGVVTKFGYDGLVICTLLAGFLLLALGIFKMGAMIRFIPYPVTTGFTTGIAVVIFSTQIKDLLGLQISNVPAEFLEKWECYFHHLHTFTPDAAIIGGLTIAIIVVFKRFIPFIPPLLAGMVLATAISTFLGFQVETIGSRFGDLPTSLPAMQLPSFHFSFSQLKEFIPSALTIAFLAAIESLLSATVADGMTGFRHKPNVELIAQGIGNLGAVLFGGIPATGAIARTATNIKSGAKTPVAGLIHAIILFLILLFLAPLAKRIPLSALAGILVVVSYNMSELEHFFSLFRAPKSDVMVLLSTFALTVLVDLTVAVEVGVVLAAVLFMRRMAEVANVEVITREVHPDGIDTSEHPEILDVPTGVEVYEVHGPFFFGAADRFQSTLQVQSGIKVVILRIRDVPVIDATGLHALDEFHRGCERKKIMLVLSGVQSQPMKALKKSGLDIQIGAQNIHTHIDSALAYVRSLFLTF